MSLLDAREGKSSTEILHRSVPGRMRLCQSRTGVTGLLNGSTSGEEDSAGLPDFECLLSNSINSNIGESLFSLANNRKLISSSMLEMEEEEEEEDDDGKRDSPWQDEGNECFYESQNFENFDYSLRFASLPEEEASFLLDCVRDGTLDLAEETFHSSSGKEVEYTILEQDHRLESLIESAQNILRLFPTTDEVGQILPPACSGQNSNS